MRLAAQAKIEYYPTSPSVVSLISGMLVRNGKGNIRSLDPCAGDHSLLGTYPNALLIYPDRIFEGVTVNHPRSHKLVANGPPVQRDMPKGRS